MSNTERPLSPHLSVYRWPLTMTISILHRLTGIAMSLGLVVLAAWLIAAAYGGDEYRRLLALLTSWPGQLVLQGISFAFFFHLANGVRHLFWDFGFGFEKKQADGSAWLVLLFAIVSTLLFWVRP